MRGLKVGVGTRDITPREDWIAAGRVFLWGFASRTEACGGILDRLSARALVVRDNRDSAIVLVSADVCALDPTVTESVRARVERAHGIPGERLCVNLTHTHGAPVTVSVPTWAQGFDTADLQYVQLVEDRIVEAVDAAVRAEAPASLQFARGATGIAIDRHFGEPGFHDPTLDVVRALDTGGRTIAIAFFTACHTVCRRDVNQINADFAGVARTLIEQDLGGVALFFEGFTGISNPKVRDAQSIGAELAKDVVALCRGPMVELAGSVDGRIGDIDLPFQPLPGPDVQERARRSGGMYARWESAMTAPGALSPGALPIPVQALRVGEGIDAWILSASGHEVTADLGPPIRALRPDNRVTLLGYSNSQLSYVPSRRVLTQPAPDEPFPFCANYEGGSSFAWYGHRAPITPDIDERFTAAHAALLDRNPAY